MASTIEQWLDSDYRPTTTPLTNAEIARTLEDSQARRQLVGPNLVKPEPRRDKIADFISRNQQGDVPLQVLGEGPTEMTFGPLQRFQVGRRRLDADKMAYLNKQFGEGNVRMSDDGNDFIVRVPDPETGKPKDVVFNEKKITFGDFFAILGAAPEAAAGLLSLRAGRAIPMEGVKRLATDIVIGSTGAAAGGAASDIEARAETGQTIDLGEIGRARAKQIPYDIALGGAGMGMARVGRDALALSASPLSIARGEIQDKAAKAIDYIHDKTGIRLAQTAGEASGWPVLIQGEQYLRAHPTSAARLSELDREIAGKVDALGQYMTAGAGSDEAAGNALKAALQTQRDVIEGRVASAAGEVRKTATGEIESAVGAATGRGPTSGIIAPGGDTRKGVLAKVESITNQSRANYSKVYELPEASEPIIPTKKLDATLADIRKNLPDREKVTEEIAYDAYGSPTTKQTSRRELMKEYVPPEVKAFVEGKFDPQMQLNKLVEMRSLIYDRVAQGEAVQGISTRYLKQMGNAITQSIDEGVSALPDGELKTRLAKANEFYKKEVMRIHEPGIGDLVAKITEPGYIEDSQVIKRLWTDPDKYKRTIAFVGEGTETATTIKRSIADSIIREASSDGTMRTVDGNRLFDGLMGFKKSNPDAFEDIFGKQADRLVQNAKAIAAATRQQDIKISTEDALTLFEPGSTSPTLKKLNDMVAAQRTRDAELKNTILREFTSSRFDPKNIKPDDFVNSFLDSGTDSEVKAVINRIRDLDPQIADQVGRKTVEKLLTKAGDSGEALEKLLSDPKYAQKIPDVIGSSAHDMLVSYKDYLKNKDKYQQIAGGTGILTKGNAIGELFRMPGLSALSDFAKKKMAAYVVSNSGLRAIASAPYTRAELPDLAVAIVTSTPFLRAAAEEMPEAPMLTSFVQSVKKAVGLMPGLEETPRAQAPVPDKSEAIRQWLDRP